MVGKLRDKVLLHNEGREAGTSLHASRMASDGQKVSNGNVAVGKRVKNNMVKQRRAYGGCLWSHTAMKAATSCDKPRGGAHIL